jgi:hypothetical protein
VALIPISTHPSVHPREKQLFVVLGYPNFALIPVRLMLKNYKQPNACEWLNANKLNNTFFIV